MWDNILGGSASSSLPPTGLGTTSCPVICSTLSSALFRDLFSGIFSKAWQDHKNCKCCSMTRFDVEVQSSQNLCCVKILERSFRYKKYLKVTEIVGCGNSCESKYAKSFRKSARPAFNVGSDLHGFKVASGAWHCPPRNYMFDHCVLYYKLQIPPPPLAPWAVESLSPQYPTFQFVYYCGWSKFLLSA